MNFRKRLHSLLNESYEEDNTDDLFANNVQLELDEAVSSALELPQSDGLEQVSDNAPEHDLSPEEQLESILPDLVDVYTGEKTDPEKDKGTVKVLVNVYLTKLREGIPLDQIMSNVLKHFNLDAELQGKLESVLQSFVEEDSPDPMLSKAEEYMESLIPSLTIAYRPGCGEDLPEYADRAKKHTLDYIRRVNGENVEINQALTEMNALFDFDDETKQKVESLLKVAGGQLDESTLQFIQEMSVPVDSTENEVEQEAPLDILEEFNSLCDEMVGVSEELGGTLAESNTDEAYAEDSYMYVAEAVSKAMALALKQGAHRGAPHVVADMMGVMSTEFPSMNEELHSKLQLGLEKAYNLGKERGDEVLYNENLFNDPGVDVKIDDRDVVDAFSNDDDVEPEEPAEEPVVTEEPGKKVVNPFERLYNERITQAFGYEDE